MQRLYFSLPNEWLIANHFLDRDPSGAPDLAVRGDELLALKEADGLAGAASALFIQARAVRANEALKSRLRARLRGARGE